MNDAKSRQTLVSALKEKLLETYDADDEILECGDPVLRIVRSRPTEIIRLTHEKLHAFPWRDVPTCWRRAYTDGSLWRAVQVLEQTQDLSIEAESIQNGKSKDINSAKGEDEEEDWIQQVVRLLDMAVILTGAPRRDQLIDDVFRRLETILEIDSSSTPPPPESNDQSTAPPPKRRKLSSPSPSSLPISIPSTPLSTPPLTHPIPRTPALSLAAFQTHILRTPAVPLILTGALAHWPALSTRPWSSPAYLLARTLGGRRLVPVEVGRSYTDEGWGQRVVPFGQFLREGVCGGASETNPGEKGTGGETVYLAQHPLLTQIPSLRADIAVPDYCYTSPAPPPTPSESDLGEPLLNAWLGPPHTISPLHTDPHDNILAQVVGYKYVRLYAPDQSHLLAPRGVGADGVDMGNTSGVDVGEMMRVVEGVDWGEEEDEAQGERDGEDGGEDGEGYGETGKGRFGRAVEGRYVEGVIGPGECVWIPRGWWHYVRSLSGSFSVSFWWD